MVYEHEIPSGSKLYFGKSAELKRRIENIAGEYLLQEGFEEIVTPLFSYHQHECFDDARMLVRLNDAHNYEVSLRADSTADVIRIVTKRLGRSSANKRWFYIQPVVTFPTIERYQVGAEIIGGDFSEAVGVAAGLLEALGVKPVLQLSNIRIPQLLNETYGIDLELFKTTNIQALLKLKEDWIGRLVGIDSVEDLKDLSGYPESIAHELSKLRDAVHAIDYEHIVIAPLYYAKLRYYDALLFRAFIGNDEIATGGVYRIEGVEASGFALNTDVCIVHIGKNENQKG